MPKCPRCKSEIGAHDIKVMTVTGEYIEVEMHCDHCEECVAFARIQSDDWIETE